MSRAYDETDTGPIGGQAYSAATQRDDVETDQAPAGGGASGQARNGSGGSVNWPTVMMAGGVSAIISALVVTIGVVGLLLSDVGRDRTSAGAQPTVVNLGSAQNESSPAAAPAGTPQAAAPAATGTAPAPAPAAEEDGSSADLPTGGGASGGGLAPGAIPQAAPTQTQSQPTPRTTQVSRSTPTVAQLQNDLDVLVGGGSNAQKAQRLEGGQRAVNQAQPVVMLLQRFKPLGFTYRVVGPVSVNGNTVKATLELKSPGYQPARMPVYWVWKGGQWKLSNRSICDIGAYAQIPCSL